MIPSLRMHLSSFAHRQEGASLIETALLVPVFLLILIGSIDLGRTCYAAIEVASAAQAGALYGAQNATDTTGMVAAAKLDAGDLTSMVPTATYGCECSDGSSASVSCTSAPNCLFNVVNYVNVNTVLNYTTMLSYPGVPHTLTLSATSRMRASH